MKLFIMIVILVLFTSTASAFPNERPRRIIEIFYHTASHQIIDGQVIDCAGTLHGTVPAVFDHQQRRRTDYCFGSLSKEQSNRIRHECETQYENTEEQYACIEVAIEAAEKESK